MRGKQERSREKIETIEEKYKLNFELFLTV
jgi:hypothetical protein